MTDSNRHLPDRTVIRVSGADWRDLFDRLLTNRLPEAGSAVSTALLTPQGKVMFDLILVGMVDGALVDLHKDHAAGFVQRMALYKLRADVALEVTELKAAAVAPGGSAAVETIIEDPRHPALGSRAYGPDARGEAPETYGARRRGLGVAEGIEIPPSAVFAAEANLDLLNGVDFKKGCFVGQEVVSRMERKTQVRRRLLAFTTDGACEVAAPLEAGDMRLGEVASLHDGGGFASVRLDRLAEIGGEDVSAAGAPVRLIRPDWMRSAFEGAA